MDVSLFDYIKWRGDLTFDKVFFNEIDAIIFSMLSYINFNGIVSADFNKNGITLEQAANDFFYAEDVLKRSDTGLLFNKELLELLKLCASSARFKNVQLCGFVDSTDIAKEKQFAAFTAVLEDGTNVVAFRGTDDSIVGWKEDFNMSFTTPVPSQKDALAYVKDVAKQLPGKIRIAGHSKGGNLSVFAATFCPDKIKRRILGVYNSDGPGFEYDITQLEEFRQIADKIHTFIPQTSIVGVLLEHEEDYIVVKSNENGIMQHNPFSWQLDGPAFVTLDKLSHQGQIIDRTIKDWLKKMDKIQREKFVDALFELLTSSDAKTFSELAEIWTKNPAGALRSLLSLDEETRHIVWKALQQLFKTARHNLPMLSDFLNRSHT